jgi:hypothetical protein
MLKQDFIRNQWNVVKHFKAKTTKPTFLLHAVGFTGLVLTSCCIMFSLVNFISTVTNHILHFYLSFFQRDP